MLRCRCSVFTGVTHSDWGVQISYQLCCCTKTKARTWKPRHVRIWVRTEQSRGPEMRLDGGWCLTSTFHAGFRLTEDGKKPCRHLTPHQFIQVSHTEFEDFSACYLWRRWWEWWRRQWIGTESLPGCWESVIWKDKIKHKVQQNFKFVLSGRIIERKLKCFCQVCVGCA